MVSLDYLRGFIDGEGAFILRVRRDKRYCTGTHVEPHINITQKHKGVLEDIQKAFGMGKLYYQRKSDLWHYNIQKLKDLLKITEAIKDNLIVKKETAEKFYRCLLIMKEKKHLTKEGVQTIINLWATPETEAKTG